MLPTHVALSLVLSWSGGGNSIDSSCMVEDKLRKPVRDAWDQELDKGKVRNVCQSCLQGSSN